MNLLLNWRPLLIAFAIGLLIGGGSVWKLRDLMASDDKVKTVERIIYRERAQADATSKVEAEATLQQERIRTVTQTIIREVPVYVSPETDARFPVPVGLVRVHDAAAAGDPLPEPSSEPDDAPGNAEASTVTASQLALTLTENYGVCTAELARFGKLQDWIKTQQAITNAPE
jgi:hypothetical protein